MASDARADCTPVVALRSLTRAVTVTTEPAAALTQPTSERFVVAQAAVGRVEKWDGSHWVDVSRPPAGSSPRQLLAALAMRMIGPTDQVRWVPPAEAGTVETAFTVIGWDGLAIGSGLSDVSFEATPV